MMVKELNDYFKSIVNQDGVCWIVTMRSQTRRL